MATGRPDPLRRLDATIEAVRGLRQILATEERLDDVLARIAVTATHAVAGADAVTVTVLANGKPRTAAWTDEDMVDVDVRQYTADRGPCLLAARTRRPVRAALGEQAARWPEFTAAAERRGVRAYLSVPLIADDLVASLNTYTRTAAPFDPFDEGLLCLYATAAAQAITTALRSQRTVSQLALALTSRAEIDQAKGVLMALHGCTADDAFVTLVTESQRTNVKLNQVARALLDSVRARRTE